MGTKNFALQWAWSLEKLFLLTFIVFLLSPAEQIWRLVRAPSTRFSRRLPQLITLLYKYSITWVKSVCPVSLWYCISKVTKRSWKVLSFCTWNEACTTYKKKLKNCGFCGLRRLGQEQNYPNRTGLWRDGSPCLFCIYLPGKGKDSMEQHVRAVWKVWARTACLDKPRWMGFHYSLMVLSKQTSVSVPLLC